MKLHISFIQSLVFAIIGMSVSVPAIAQSTAQYTKTENRNCLVWNFYPVPNETVYWTGKCVNGMAEGKGMIAYGVIKDGKPQVSISDVTLENGKQIGLGEYYSRTGQISKRSYANGQRTSSEPYIIADETPSVKQDIFASRFRGGLVREVGMSDIKALAEYGGFEVTQERIIENKPFIMIKADNGLKIFLYGQACKFDNGVGCRGLSIGASFKSAEPLSYDQVNTINKRYSLIKMTRGAQDLNQYEINLYTILDAGQKPDNLHLAMTNFEAIANKLSAKFNATQD